MSVPLTAAVDFLPRTRRSKSFSPRSLLPFDDKPLLGFILMRSLERGLSEVVLQLEANSRSFRVCSCSNLVDRDLINFINSWNCWRLSRGPRLKAHRIGRTSMARNSESAILPTCLKTASAAIITAGSFVFIAFSSGTTFSCTVYLSRIALLFCFWCFWSFAAPS